MITQSTEIIAILTDYTSNKTQTEIKHTFTLYSYTISAGSALIKLIINDQWLHSMWRSQHTLALSSSAWTITKPAIRSLLRRYISENFIGVDVLCSFPNVVTMNHDFLKILSLNQPFIGLYSNRKWWGKVASPILRLSEENKSNDWDDDF